MQPTSHDKSHLRDVIESCELAIAYLGRQALAELAADSRNLNAIIRRIEVVGEATKRLGEALRIAHSEVTSPDRAAIRDRLIHGNDRVDVRRVWDTAAVQMPALLPTLHALFESLPDAT